MNYYSFVPKDSDKTFELKAGNYLDKSFLLYVLLNEAGLNPSFSYLSDKTVVNFKDDLASPVQFKGGQVVVNIDGKNFYLFPSNERQRYDQIPVEYQGAWALELLGFNPGSLYRNPMDNPALEGEVKTEKAEMTADGDLFGHIRIEPKGNNEISWRDLKALKKEEMNNYFEEYVHDIHPSARLLSYNIDNLNNVDLPLSIRIDYKAAGYAVNVADKYLIFKFPEIKITSQSVGQAKRELPFYFMSKEERAKSSEIKLPPGYEVYHVPPKADIRFKGNHYIAEYNVSGDSLVLNEDYITEETEISPADYSSYKAYVEKIADFTDNWLVLKKK
jgi:hypothetical protein